MLSQGIINTLALDQLNEASSLQLIDLGEKDSPKRSLGAKILSSSFYQKSNLKVDILKTNILLENLINQDGINTIKVKEGSIISKKGKPISSQQFDILEHFNKVSRSPRPIKVVNYFLRIYGKLWITSYDYEKRKAKASS